MTDHPILFNGEMVEAILDGRKTQTRRIVTCPRNPRGRRLPYEPWEVEEDGRLIAQDEYGDYLPIEETQRPYGVAGDRLVPRTTWAVSKDADHIPPRDLPTDALIWNYWNYDKKPKWCGKSRPGMFLPKRLWWSVPRLHIEAVRAERLQEISSADAIKEGIRPASGGHMAIDCETERPEDGFLILWDSINGARPGCAWECNPWVWVVTFKRIGDDDA